MLSRFSLHLRTTRQVRGSVAECRPRSHGQIALKRIALVSGYPSKPLEDTTEFSGHVTAREHPDERKSAVTTRVEHHSPVTPTLFPVASVVFGADHLSHALVASFSAVRRNSPSASSATSSRPRMPPGSGPPAGWAPVVRRQLGRLPRPGRAGLRVCVHRRSGSRPLEPWPSREGRRQQARIIDAGQRSFGASPSRRGGARLSAWLGRRCRRSAIRSGAFGDPPASCQRSIVPGAKFVPPRVVAGRPLRPPARALMVPDRLRPANDLFEMRPDGSLVRRSDRA